MPEGPEVRRYADLLAANLENSPLLELNSRLKVAKAWLTENRERIVGREILKIESHGKHLLGFLAGDFYFHSHLMMWGRWQIFDSPPAEIDRRERTRIVTAKATAVLFSAPTFALGEGNPYLQIPILAELGTDVLPYRGEFDRADFLKRLFEPENLTTTIGAALLNQRILAGVGNYLRAEILFECRMNPWREIGELSSAEIECLSETIPRFCRFGYEKAGRTVSDEEREMMLAETHFTYSPGSDWGAKHYVFRRTNLPCLRCGEKVRQKRQVTRADDDGEKTRIIYFCPNCQAVNLDLLNKPQIDTD